MLWESKSSGFEGDGEVGERSCGEQGSYRVPGMTLEAAAGGEEQSLPSAPRQDHLSSRPGSPQGTGSCSPARLSSHREGAPVGWGFPQALPLLPSTLALHAASCLVGWLGRLLNGPLFTGFSSARRANHLIP